MILTVLLSSTHRSAATTIVIVVVYSACNDPGAFSDRRGCWFWHIRLVGYPAMALSPRCAALRIRSKCHLLKPNLCDDPIALYLASLRRVIDS